MSSEACVLCALPSSITSALDPTLSTSQLVTIETLPPYVSRHILTITFIFTWCFYSNFLHKCIAQAYCKWVCLVTHIWEYTKRQYNRACFKKISSHCTFGRKISQRPFLGFYPKILHFISQKFWWLFFSHHPFSRSSILPYLTHCPSFLFLNSTFYRQKFLDDLFLGFYTKILHVISQKFWWSFFSHRPF